MREAGSGWRRVLDLFYSSAFLCRWLVNDWGLESPSQKVWGTIVSKILQTIAQDVRIWAEENHLWMGFHDDLRGMCAVASAELFRRLEENQIGAVFACNPDHCFVVCKDYYLLDITASQFGQDDVVVIEDYESIDAVNYPYWQVSDSYNSIPELVTYQKVKWPARQWADRIYETPPSSYRDFA